MASRLLPLRTCFLQARPALLLDQPAAWRPTPQPPRRRMTAQTFASVHAASTWPAEVDEHIMPDLSSSALVVIDTQNDFVDGGTSPVAGTSAIVPALCSLQAAFRAAGLPIVHVVRIYRGDDVDRLRRGVIASGIEIVAPDTDGAQVVSDLSRDWHVKPSARSLLNGEIVEVNVAEFVMWKPRWSAFHRTRLHDFLRGVGVTTVVIAGCNFPNCPRATIYDSSSLDYRVLVPSDALSNIRFPHLEELGKIGVLHTLTAHITDKLGSTTSSLGPRILHDQSAGATRRHSDF